MRTSRLISLVVALIVVGGGAAAVRALDVDDAAAPPTTTTTTTAAGGTIPTTAATTTTEPVPVPGAEVAALAERTVMTDAARDVFFRAEPRLVGKDELGATCDLRSEVSVLGCFAAGRITVLDITEARLDGMTETTAAHEMLHAVWAGLPDDERIELTSRLLTAYDAVRDELVREKVEAYRSDDPAVVPNELHSILGTEVAALPAELEHYYARWFTDRTVVVTLASGARSTFAAIEDEVAALDAQLASLGSAVADAQALLDARRARLDALSAELDRLRAAGDVSGYNARVGPYNDEAAQYNAQAQQVQARIDEYNAIVARRNALVAEWSALREPIDTTAAPVDPAP